MSLPYGPPYPVSPLIRGARFALLLAGIVYGRVKQSRYEYLEDIWREEEAERKIIRDKEHAKIKARIAKEEAEVIRQIETGDYFKEDCIKPDQCNWMKFDADSLLARLAHGMDLTNKAAAAAYAFFNKLKVL